MYSLCDAQDKPATVRSALVFLETLVQGSSLVFFILYDGACSKIASMKLEGLKNRCTFEHIFLNLFISGCQLGQQFEDLRNLVLRNDHHPVDWIAKCKVARRDEGSINVERYLDRPG